MGLKTYYLNASDALADIFRPAASVIENKYYRVELVNGGIKQITDKVAGNC